jgi:ABC-type dipeptide/oligopeptide/nickel transport system permease subunit
MGLSIRVSAIPGACDMEANSRKNNTLKQTVRVFFGRGILSRICFAAIVLFILVALTAPVLTPYSPYEQELTNTYAAPSARHLLGTDNLGRDLLTRLLYGARISLVTSLLSSVWAAVIGTILGLISGYCGGVFNQVIMRITDAMLSIPPLIMTMVLAAILGGSVMGVSIVIGISIFPTYVRMVNGLVLSLRENDYIVAARLIGQKNWRILMHHLLPNCFASLIVIFTMNLGSAIMLEATLSYLGVGITAPTPAWGSMVSVGYKYLLRCPRIAILPGLCVMIVVIAFNVVGDGLRDALDPRLRGKL